MKYLITLVLLCMSTFSNAAWINVSGKITNLSTYANTETILVTLDNHGRNIEECSNKTTFAISNSISAEARARMYANLLAAKTAKNTVTIAYSEVGSCEPWDSNPSGYRKILRLQ